MEEKTKCPLCKDLHNNCFVEQTEIEGEPFESYICFECGMTSNSYLAFDSEKLEEYTENHSTLMNDLKIPKKDLINIIKHGVSSTKQDCVIIFITVSGIVNSNHTERIYKKIFYPEKLNGRLFTAIELTTASGLLTMVELFLQNKLSDYGYHKQEEVKLSEAVSTKFGSLYTM